MEDRINKSCAACALCFKTAAMLKSIKTDEEKIALCEGNEEFPCQYLPNNIRRIGEVSSPETANNIIEFIEEIFAGNEDMVYDTKTSVTKNPPFRCPELEIDIYQPCQVTSCSFHAKHPWARNCILYYMVRQERQHLTNNDLSFLVGLSTSTLRSELIKAMQQVRKAALKEEISKDIESNLDKRSQNQSNKEKIDACEVCKKPTTNKSLSAKRGIKYCSRVCYREKPPIVFKIENEFALPIKRILQLCAERFASINLMANAVGVSQTAFLELCKKYKIEVVSC